MNFASSRHKKYKWSDFSAAKLQQRDKACFGIFFTPTGENYYVLTLILYVSQLGFFFWKLKPTTTKKLKVLRRCPFYPTQLKCCRSHKRRQSDKLSSFQCLISNWRGNGCWNGGGYWITFYRLIPHCVIMRFGKVLVHSEITALTSETFV